MPRLDYEAMSGMTVVDEGGNKLGKVEALYLDDETANVDWASVKTGLFGTHVSLLPLATAEQVDGTLRVPFDKETVKGSPHVEPGTELSPAEEARLFEHYGVPYGGATVTAKGSPNGGSSQVVGSRGDAMTRSEEEVRVAKATRETGRVRLRKYVVTENVERTVPVSHEEVRVEREPIYESNVDAAMSGPDISEAEHEVVLHEEEPVVEKRAVPKERVRLEKDAVPGEADVDAEVRKERIEVEGDDRRDRRAS